ncbi:MAG TPA: hypothetical protein VK173_09470 [Lacibacter sp.]|nr:hypothetical protein [Lacibacter sp.]
MQSKRPLVPSFINKLDRYLLLHHPVIWTTRAHLVKYYSLLFAVVLALLCFIVPSNPLADSNSFVWTTLTSVLSFIGIILWVIYLLRFNVFKRFGDNGKLDALKNFLLFFVAIGFMIAPTYIPTAVESIRANAAFGNEEVVNDINTINTKINQLEYDSLDHQWDKEIVIVRDSLPQQMRYEQADNDHSERVLFMDTAELKGKLLNVDSTIKINDSTYHFYSCPKYTFLDDNYADRHTTTKAKTSIELYNGLIKHFNPVDKKKVRTELETLLKKYRYSEYGYYYDSDVSRTGAESYYNVIEKRYNLYTTNNGIRNLTDKKYRWYTENDSRFRVWFYMSFVLSLLVFIFRHGTVKAFFLSILTCIVLTILSALFLAFAHGGEGATVLGLCIGYYILFFTATLLGMKRNTRSTLAGIALNITTFFTFIIPFLCMLLYYEGQDKIYRHLPDYPPGYQETKEMALLIVEIGGILLFLFLLQPLFKRLYRNWFSKPEE